MAPKSLNNIRIWPFVEKKMEIQGKRVSSKSQTYKTLYNYFQNLSFDKNHDLAHEHTSFHTKDFKDLQGFSSKTHSKEYHTQ